MKEICAPNFSSLVIGRDQNFRESRVNVISFLTICVKRTNLWITISPCYQEFEWKTSQFKCAFTWKAILWNAKNCFQAFFRECEFNHLSTMLQKLSKCEVKAWFCWNLIILPPLRFYVKLNFGKFEWSKNVICNNFRGFEFWF